MKLRDRIAAARARLAAAGIDSGEAGRDAALLARHVLGWDRAKMLTNDEDTPDQDFLDRFDALIERRARREPVAYIRGVQEFWGRDFLVNASVLIPRPETELIIEEFLARLPIDAPARPRRVADIGTGSGCLAVTAAAERPYVEVIATDISGRRASRRTRECRTLRGVRSNCVSRVGVPDWRHRRVRFHPGQSSVRD